MAVCFWTMQIALADLAERVLQCTPFTHIDERTYGHCCPRASHDAAHPDIANTSKGSDFPLCVRTYWSKAATAKSSLTPPVVLWLAKYLSRPSVFLFLFGSLYSLSELAPSKLYEELLLAIRVRWGPVPRMGRRSLPIMASAFVNPRLTAKQPQRPRRCSALPA
jgi:hypothetical protein